MRATKLCLALAVVLAGSGENCGSSGDGMRLLLSLGWQWEVGEP